MASGDNSRVKPIDPSTLTKATSRKSKPVDYKQMLSGNCHKAEWDDHGYDSSSHGESQFYTGLYHDPLGFSKFPEMEEGVVE